MRSPTLHNDVWKPEESQVTVFLAGEGEIRKGLSSDLEGERGARGVEDRPFAEARRTSRAPARTPITSLQGAHV